MRRKDVSPTLMLKAIEDDVSVLTKQFPLHPSEAYDRLLHEIHHLEAHARIQDFVPLLAMKHVKARLRAQPPQYAAVTD